MSVDGYMTTHIIILAQGSQKRLPKLPVAKQMLPLPACGNAPILYRTISQLGRLVANAAEITVVTWLPLMEQILMERRGVGVDTLSDPGNSSLRGIARYLAQSCEHRAAAAFDRTVVLLGDVVYSWACLRALLDDRGTAFVGTKDLSASGGELWGIVWTAYTQPMMLEALADALAKHPPYADYQPGQLRRWLWAFDERWKDDSSRPWYTAVDDYTRDIDLPEHVEMLPALSKQAMDDDALNGVTW